MPNWDKRATNRQNSTALLDSRGVEYTSSNNGAHLQIAGPYGMIDFWPGTGKWVDRTKKFTSRGVHDRLQHLEGKS